jgi:hypothetical protein
MHGEPSDGGGLWCRGCIVEDCRFQANIAWGKGGGAYLEDSELTRCEFIGNEGGGALYAVRSTISSSDFVASTLTGLGVYDALVQDCFIASNHGVRGGGIVTSGSEIEGCVILQNDSFYLYLWEGIGGGAYCFGPPSLFRNCTFWRNRAEVTGGAVYVEDEGSVTLENCIIAETVTSDAVACGQASSASLTCCDLYGNEGGDWIGCLAGLKGVDGNFSADPRFCQPIAWDFSLHSASPCLPGAHPHGEDCGLIGSEGEGCTSPTLIERRSWGSVKEVFHPHRQGTESPR